jgi:hypothetical protein
MRLRHFEFLLLFFAIAVAGCSPKLQNGKTSKSEDLKPESAHGATTGAPVAQPGLKLTPPPGWVSETPSSASRKAQYKLPRVGGDTEDAALVVYYFAGGGGTPQANVERWIGEFAGPDGKPVSNAAKITHKTVDGIPLTIVDARGAYASSMGSMQSKGGQKPGFRLLGAIAETGNGPWFIKLTGPERTVAKWESSFESFLNSVKQGK